MTKVTIPTRQELRSQGTKILVHDLLEGIGMCVSNAREFLAEAALLTANRHNRHAVGLLELAVEELGKAQHMVHCSEDATILGKKSTTMILRVTRSHQWKLLFSPKGHVASHSREERRMRNRLRRSYSAGTTLRERSFYVDHRRGTVAVG